MTVLHESIISLLQEVLNECIQWYQIQRCVNVSQAHTSMASDLLPPSPALISIPVFAQGAILDFFGGTGLVGVTGAAQMIIGA